MRALAELRSGHVANGAQLVENVRCAASCDPAILHALNVFHQESDVVQFLRGYLAHGVDHRRHGQTFSCSLLDRGFARLHMLTSKIMADTEAVYWLQASELPPTHRVDYAHHDVR